MNMQDVIAVKRDGGKLSKEQIDFFTERLVGGNIPEYQTAALLMAMYINKLTKEEAFWLTDAMKRSGEVIDLSAICGIKVDKHSTGGVGDKTTLITGPLAAACGAPVAKMSGRGLGFTGGTIDKLEAIPGFRTEIEPDELIRLVNQNGIAIAGQSGQLAPADKKIYALRDVTGTMASTGLITASVMSKKLAAGADAIVLDVKCGAGAFMEEEAAATELGEWLVEIGSSAGKKTVAFITEMGEPLGRAVGNANEVIEAIETLKGKGPQDVEELSLRLAGHMIYLAQKADIPAKGYQAAKEKLQNGEALQKLREFIAAQGGDPRVTEDYTLFPAAKHQISLQAEATGYINRLDAGEIGRASGLAGAGRACKDDTPDLSAGIYLCKKTGDFVQTGEALAILSGGDQSKLEEAAQAARKAYGIGEEQPEKPVLIKRIIE